MAKSKIREIALISLPIVFLGGFGWWANGRQQQRAARENGPYRTRLVSIEDVPLTPFERWQGFDSKVRIVATDDGKPDLPAGINLTGRRSLECEAFLIGDSTNQKIKLPISDSGIGNDGISDEYPGALLRIYDFKASRQESENVGITFLANTSEIVDGKANLSGNLRIENGTYRNIRLASVPGFALWREVAGTYTFHARSTKIEHSLQRSQHPADQTSPRPLSTQVTHLNPREARSDPMNDGNDTLVRAEFDCSKINRKDIVSSRFVDPHLEDEFGKRVELKNGSRPVNVYIGGISVGAEQKVSFDDRLPLGLVPAERGQITLKTWFSYRNSWPTPVSIIVRPRPHTATPNKLKLQSVRLVGGQVEARVRYVGKLTLQTEQDAPETYDALSSSSRPDPRAAGTDRLISNYSQHLELPNGKKQWSSQYVGDARAKCKADNSCVVTYPLPALKSWAPGQTARFKAQIGIEDDGFLDIDLPITKPK